MEVIEPVRHCVACGAVLVRGHRFTRDGKPNGREPLQHFMERQSCGRKCQKHGRSLPWHPDEKRILRALYPFFPAPVIARGLGKSVCVVLRMAEFEGLKKTARGRSKAASYAQRRRSGKDPFADRLMA